MKRPQLLLIPPFVLCAGLLAAYALYPAERLPEGYRMYILAGAAAVLVVLLIVLFTVLSRWNRSIHTQMDNVFEENGNTAGFVVQNVPLPCLLVDETGRIAWRNEVMGQLYDGQDLRTILPDYDFAEPAAACPCSYHGGEYQIMSMPVHRKSTDRYLTFQYWVDRTEAEHYHRLYEERMPHVALIYVDNTEELSADHQFHRDTVLQEVERLLIDMVTGINGVWRKFETGRYIVIFDAVQLTKLRSERFPLLDAVRRIETGTSAQVSLSIAIGASETLEKSEADARSAMEICLGRGGDQVVIKSGANMEYFGGTKQLDTVQSRVKVRRFASALRQLFENSGDIVIMGHRNPDMDCIGPALGLVTCARQIGSRAYIVLEDVNDSIALAVEQMRTSSAYADTLVTPEQAEKILRRQQSVLVVVDTQRPGQTLAPDLLDIPSKVVVIDHHRRGTDHIENMAVGCLESRASSASELVTEVMQYFDEKIKPPSFVSSALLAGITLDTNHFSFSVGARTFEAAGYLRRYGADLSMVKQLFQDDMTSYLACAKAVGTAETVMEGVTLAYVEDGGADSNLIAAKTADQLIGIRGIEASFVIANKGGVYYVSGRSLGRVNVQIICEKLGGGGHLLNAGAQLYEKESMQDALAQVRSAIEEYDREVRAAD